ncbi:recombinase family protein [Micromonospora chokoriensis]
MTSPQPKPFAFYGRVSTEDNQDPESSRGWQLTRATALIQPHGGRIVTEYFDVGQSRSLPWQRRTQANTLLSALRNPRRGFSAVVVGEPHRAFYGNQFGLTVPLFAHYGVELWVPEIGGPIDPDNEAHELVMSVFGGMSKGERNRIKLRVRTAMAAQTLLEGRYLGGRPPYGYTLRDLGPHPNPAKAADGKHLRGLTPDAQTSPIVRRIFDEFLAGYGLFAIAEGLTANHVPCPSAHDPARNRHRQYNHGAAYYRCRFPQEYALANKVEHPRNVYLREDALTDPLDEWLASAFTPDHLDQTITAMCDAQPTDTTPQKAATQATIAACDAKLAQYRAALDAGADPALVTGWITQTQAERTRAEADLQTTQQTEPRRMSHSQIADLVRALGDIVAVLRDADPDDKAEVYRQLGLRLTYQTETQTVRAAVDLSAHRGVMGRVRGATRTIGPPPMTFSATLRIAKVSPRC